MENLIDNKDKQEYFAFGGGGLVSSEIGYIDLSKELKKLGAIQIRQKMDESKSVPDGCFGCISDDCEKCVLDTLNKND